MKYSTPGKRSNEDLPAHWFRGTAAKDVEESLVKRYKSNLQIYEIVNRGFKQKNTIYIPKLVFAE